MSDDSHFDNMMCTSATVEDIDHILMTGYLNGRGDRSDYDPATLGGALDVVRGSGCGEHPVNVGLMFFNHHPEDFFPGSYIDIVHIPDSMEGWYKQDRAEGTVDRQIEMAYLSISNLYIGRYVTETSDGVRTVLGYTYPPVAVREALCNAMFHRAYDIPKPVVVTVTSRMMGITSFPGPDPDIPMEDIINGTMVSDHVRNGRVGGFLKGLGYVRGENSGLPLIKRAMMNNGSDPPSFITDEDRTFLSVILPVNRHFHEAHESGGVARAESAIDRYNHVSMTADVLGLLYDDGGMDAFGISEGLGLGEVTPMLMMVLMELVDSGHLECAVPGLPVVPNQVFDIPDGFT